MRVAAISLDSSLDDAMPKRIERAAHLVASQAGADLVVLPELWAHGAFAYQSWADTAEPLDGPTISAISKAAASIGAHVHAGSIIERDAGGRLYNTSVLLSPSGDVVSTYRKIHLFGFGAGEATVLTRGSEIVTYRAPASTAVFGLATCYDLRFPEMFRALVDAGSTVLLLPSGWPDPRIEHWRILSRARAIESQAYVIAVNAAGTHSGHRMGGHAAIIDPWGMVLAESGDEPDVITTEIDPEFVISSRERFPVLADRVLGRGV